MTFAGENGWRLVAGDYGAAGERGTKKAADPEGTAAQVSAGVPKK